MLRVCARRRASASWCVKVRSKDERGGFSGGQAEGLPVLTVVSLARMGMCAAEVQCGQCRLGGRSSFAKQCRRRQEGAGSGIKDENAASSAVLGGNAIV